MVALSVALSLALRGVLSVFSKFTGDFWPRPLCRRRGLYQASIHVKIAMRASATVSHVRPEVRKHSVNP